MVKEGNQSLPFHRDRKKKKLKIQQVGEISKAYALQILMKGLTKLYVLINSTN